MNKTYQIYHWAKKANIYLTDYPRTRDIIRKIFVKWQSTNNHTKIEGKSNKIDINNSIVKNSSFDINGDRNTIVIGAEAIIENVTFYIRGCDHNIYIGKNCRFTNGGKIWIEDRNCNLSIGDNTYIVNVDISITEPNSSIEIGKNCLFAYSIDIRNGDSHSIIDLASGKRINLAQNIKIADHVWIGAYSKILKGVTINQDSVVGIASVVTQDVSSNTVVAGIPAKVIKENITWDSERI
ncbi:acyltransferase [Waterburya agarophytonicola K14]|uniref:Acyltransferase n=1 Tax=Waterburya agarophytonicola KI4 TaxID=2874699 RepID=A0A964BMB2_9CYAN|nr:acyltransferase [Waterburya agarophytonicola]MCC0175950.1 acyltransferase [Waterburya agarophytonicola KI4]